MSAINGSGNGLFQFLQQLSGNTSASSTPTVASAAGVTTPTSGQAVSGASHHHKHGGGGFKKIEDAVTSALQSAQSNSSSDPNQIIEDALAKVLSADPTASNPATSANANGVTPAADSDGDTNSSGTSNAASATSTTPSSAKQSFFQTLQSFGVSPQQFHSDFLAAIKDAQGGQVDPGTAFQSFPPGVNLDVLG